MKNKNFYLILGILVVLVILGVIFYSLNKKGNNLNISNQENNISLNLNQQNNQDLKDIVVISPKQDEKISSPLKIFGEARGYWFFEAQFNVELYDESKNLLGQAILTAKDDWMTENFVPFEGELIFNQQPNTNKGFLKFLSANPSGEIEKQKVFELPVSF